MELWGLKNCDSCKKAMKALEAANIAYTFHDIRAGGLTEDKISQWLAAVGADGLVNRKSTTWRALGDAEKAKADNPQSVIVLLLDNPTLVKRPVVETKTSVLVGWNKQPEDALVQKL